MKAALPLLALLLAAVSGSYAQESPQSTAANEAVYRQANRLNLRQKLGEARAAVDRHEYSNAAKLYDEAWDLVQKIGSGVDAERQETVVGLSTVRMELAREAQNRGDLREAGTQVDDVLRVDPQNLTAREFKAHNDKLLKDLRGKMPSEDVSSKVPAMIEDKVKSNTHVQDGKLYYEMGKLDEAEAQLNLALKTDPLNPAAYYYLNLIREARYKEAMSRRDVASRQGLVEVAQAWATPPKRDLLPVPNPYARTNLIFTSRGRQLIVSKLDRIVMQNVGPWENLPLGEVIKVLSDEAKKRDPEHRGLNFIINPNTDVGAAPLAVPTGAVDATGQPIPAPAPEAVDMSAINIRINPPLTDVRLADVLEAIVKVADRPIKYSIEDYAVVFSLKGRDPQPLYLRTFKVDPNTFMQGLESVVGFQFAAISTSSGGGGGGGGGGGAGGGQTTSLPVPVVLAAGGQTIGGTGGGGGGAGGGGGQGGNGLRAVTLTNDMTSVQVAVRQFFTTMGVDLTVPGKSVFFNDREGSLVVRATLQDLDTIETAVQVLNIAPPQVNIKAKFVEVDQTDARALGFDWYLGNVLMNNGAMGVQAGTAPSFAGAPSAANPEGTFPGSAANGTTIPASTTDQLLTSGLRNQLALRNTTTVPTLATLTGILTDPQFRVVLHALDQRTGADLLNESSVTTLSGRQTQIQVVDLETIVTGTSLNQTATGGTGGTLTGASGGGAVASSVNYPTSILPFGPTLDVVPYVSADGYTIQLTIIPTITEFIGYDDPGAFVPQAQSVSGGANGVGVPITAQLPLPHFRLRQVTTSAIVWDGQTVVLGGLITENVTKIKDKVPVLGDLPLVGVLFRSESSATAKRNLMIFVTPTIIDPAGNRLHSDEDMPFAQSLVPPQKPVVPTAQ